MKRIEGLDPQRLGVVGRITHPLLVNPEPERRAELDVGRRRVLQAARVDPGAFSRRGPALSFQNSENFPSLKRNIKLSAPLLFGAGTARRAAVDVSDHGHRYPAAERRYLARRAEG